jgi:hypothetical protein
MGCAAQSRPLPGTRQDLKNLDALHAQRATRRESRTDLGEIGYGPSTGTGEVSFSVPVRASRLKSQMPSISDMILFDCPGFDNCPPFIWFRIALKDRKPWSDRAGPSRYAG